MGLRGSGQHYYLPSDSCWAQLGLQRNKWSDRHAVEFTVNLSVVSRAVWARTVETDPWVGAKPSPNLYTLTEGRFQESIHIVAGGGFQWWHLSADGSDEDATCSDFLATMAEHGVPTLRREVALRS
jgi:hypothetical protein